MLTLNEIRNVNFRKANFGGYRAEDVEAFIDEVQLSYDTLLRENAELVKKLEVLAAKLEEYQGEEDGRPRLGLNFVDDCFITSTAEKTENGYKATFRFPREKILTGDGEVFFNAYRLETDGGEEMNKRLFSLNPVMRTWFHTPDKYVKLGDYVEN